MVVLYVSGIDANIIFFLLILLNGFFCFVKVPILSFMCIGISAVYLLGFSIDYNGLNLILSLILIMFAFSSAYLNYEDYNK